MGNWTSKRSSGFIYAVWMIGILEGKKEMILI